MTTKRFRIYKQQFACHHIRVSNTHNKILHDRFPQFEYNEADWDRHVFSVSTHHREIFVNYPGLSECGSGQCRCLLLLIADEMHVDSISDLLHNLSEISVFPVTCKGQTRIRYVPYIDECCSNRSTVWTMDSCRTLWVSEFWWGLAARKMQIATVKNILRFLSEVRCEFLFRLPVSVDNFPRVVAQHLERDIQVFGCHSRSRIVRRSGYDKSHSTISVSYTHLTLPTIYSV